MNSLSNYRNVAYVKGSGEGDERKQQIVGDASGIERFELFVDARDVSDTRIVEDVEEPIPDDEYYPMLTQRGNEKLADTKEVFTFESEINTKSNLTYKKDYNLGDIVTTFSRKWGIVSHPRITEITETVDQNGYSLQAVLGNAVPTLVDKIKNSVR